MHNVNTTHVSSRLKIDDCMLLRIKGFAYFVMYTFPMCTFF